MGLMYSSSIPILVRFILTSLFKFKKDWRHADVSSETKFGKYNLPSNILLLHFWLGFRNLPVNINLDTRNILETFG